MSKVDHHRLVTEDTPQPLQLAQLPILPLKLTLYLDHPLIPLEETMLPIKPAVNMSVAETQATSQDQECKMDNTQQLVDSMLQEEVEADNMFQVEVDNMSQVEVDNMPPEEATFNKPQQPIQLEVNM